MFYVQMMSYMLHTVHVVCHRPESLSGGNGTGSFKIKASVNVQILNEMFQLTFSSCLPESQVDLSPSDKSGGFSSSDITDVPSTCLLDQQVYFQKQRTFILKGSPSMNKAGS